MTDYQVLARRFRPKTLDEVVGQASILNSLESALASQRLPHAFLFSGSRGVGKTTLARILARCLNCERGVSKAPCGSCNACLSILDGSNSDVVEIDAASHNLVDDIRELRDRVGFASMGSRYKVYILDEVHMLTRSAFNAFLKTLEEPPARVVFILATTELHKVPETIRSRCQVLLFERLSEADITRRLQAICAHEQVAIPADVLGEIARGCRGGMRDAETELERVLPVAAEALAAGEGFDIGAYRRLVHRVSLDDVVELVEQLVAGNASAALHFVDRAVGVGVDEREALGEVLEVLRALLLIQVDGPETGLVQFHGEVRQRLQALAGNLDTTRLDAMVHAGLLGRERIRRLEDRRLVLEVSLIRMVAAGQLPLLAELVQQVRDGVPPALGTVPAAVAPVAGAPLVPGGGVAAGQQSLHGRLLALCREQNSLLARSLEECRVSEVGADGVVRIEVLSQRKLHRDRLQSDGVQQELRQRIQQILGRDVELAVTLGAAGSGAPTAPSPGQPSHAQPSHAQSTPSPGPPDGGDAGAAPHRSGRQPKPGPAVRRVMKRFDGQILKVNDQEARADDNEEHA